MKTVKRIGILTGGGDCPGLNAVIRAVTKMAILDYGMEVVGFEDGFYGVMYNHHRPLSYGDVSGILAQGGTILGTSNTANPYRCAVKKAGRLAFRDCSKAAIEHIRRLKISCLVCIGGDGTLAIANSLFADGVPIVAVPKTIDNDLRETDVTFGFDTACQIATEGIDRLHSTAQSHHRVMIIEVMGRKAGWIALHAGVAGGGDIILIPEIPYRIDAVAEMIRHRHRYGKRFSIVVIAEGAKPAGGDVVVRRIIRESPDTIRLGGVGFVLGNQIEKATGIETRTVVMGHLLRGGSPSSFDRVLATRLGTAAVEMIAAGKFGYMVAVRGAGLTHVPLERVAGGPRLIPLDHPLLKSARSVGCCFGD